MFLQTAVSCPHSGPSLFFFFSLTGKKNKQKKQLFLSPASGRQCILCVHSCSGISGSQLLFSLTLLGLTHRSFCFCWASSSLCVVLLFLIYQHEQKTASSSLDEELKLAGFFFNSPPKKILLEIIDSWKLVGGEDERSSDPFCTSEQIYL